MAAFVRTKMKRVTYSLDDKVKARLVGGDSYDGVSSGSEHSGDNSNDHDHSPCLSELVHDFFESSESTRFPDCDSDSDRVDSARDSDGAESILRSAAVSGNDPYLVRLRTHVSEAAAAFDRLRSGGGGGRSALRRSVASFLRGRGHNAAVCKTSWPSSGHITAGSYEFVDVVAFQSGSSTWQQSRYVVDLDLAAEFEIARPSAQYSRLLQSLPRTFVGGADDLKRIVRVMCDAAKRSLKGTDLSVPPWRKNRYMQNKWFGTYKRTVNNPLPEKPFSRVAGAKCRWVGFDDVVSDSGINGRVYVRT